MAILTLTDMSTDVVDRLGYSTSDTALVAMIKKWANSRYKEICSKYDWPFLQDIQELATVAEYTTGTIDLEEEGTTITGTDTVWTKDMVGRKIKFPGWNETHTISAWTSTTSITITPAYRGDDIDDGTYTIFKDDYLCPWNWDAIRAIRQFRSPKELDKISSYEMRRDYGIDYPQTADPQRYCLFEKRNITKINVDGFNGSNTYADVVADQWVAGGTSKAYGWVRRSAADASDGAYLYIEILSGTFTDGETLTFYSDVESTATEVTCTVNETDGYTEGNVGNVLNIHFNPVPYRIIKLDIDMTYKPYEMVANDDEPLIPEKYRDLLIFGACADCCMKKSKPNDMSYYEAKYMKRYKDLVGEYLNKELAFAQIIPVVRRKTFD
jgi:hypothetical protein